MKNGSMVVALSALTAGFGLVSQAVTISATPGMDYKGATIAVAGAAANVDVVVNSYGSSQTPVFSTNVTAAAAGTGFFVEGLNAGAVYEITASDGSTSATNRLYQGEAGYDTVGWFSESATTSQKQGTWDKKMVVQGERYVFTDDEDEQGHRIVSAFSPNDSQSDRLAIIEMDVTFGGALSDADAPSMAGTQSALKVVDGGDGKFYFSYYTNGEWVKSDSEAVVDAVYSVRITLDRFNGTVCYEVKKDDVAYTTLYNGASTSVTKAVTNIAFAGEGTLGTLTGNNSQDTATANVCEAGGTKYKSVEEAISNSTSVALLWDASWFAPEENVAYTISGGKALKVLGGMIAAGTTLPTNTTLAGGRYTKKSGQGTVASGYRMAERVSSDEYKYEVLKGSTQIAADEKVYPVSDGTRSVDIAFSKTDLVDKGIGVTSEMSDAQVQEKLNAKGSNNNPAWENVVLGLANNDASAKPVVRPVQSSDATKITFALGGVTIDSKYNANVYYKVLTSATPGGTPTATSDYVPAGNTIAVGLPDTGVQYYQLQVDAAGAK